MKKVLVCILAALFVATAAFATTSTIEGAKRFLSEQAKADLEYVQKAKAEGTLDLNDPRYQRLVQYYRMDFEAGNTGRRTVDVGNDNCPAVIIPSLPYTDAGNTIGYTNDFTCAGNSAPDVVYQYTATASGSHTFSLCGSSYDTRLEVRNGACPGSALLCNDDWCGLSSEITTNLTAGQTVTIVVDGYSSAGNAGAYVLNVTGPSGGGGCTADLSLTAPGSVSGTTAGDNCNFRAGPDHIIEVTIPTTGEWTFALCEQAFYFDTYLYVSDACCGGSLLAVNDDGCSQNSLQSIISCLYLAAGTYYVDVEPYSGGSGPYTLTVTPCAPPTGRCCYGDPQSPSCADLTQADCANLGGTWDQYQTCATPCPVPPPPPLRTFIADMHGCFVGISVGVDCRGTLYYTDYCNPYLYKIDAFGNPLGQVLTVDQTGAPKVFDELSWDESRQMFWTANNTNIYLLDPVTGIATYQFPGQAGISLTDGIAFDPTDGTVWHSTDVSSNIAHFTATGLLLGTLTPLDANGNPDGTISGICVGTNNTMYVGHNGLGYITRNNKTTGAFLGTFAVPGGRDEGLECDPINFAPQLALWTKGAYDGSFTAFLVDSGTCVCFELPDTCEFAYDGVDMGDLAQCNYPTLVNNPAHALTHIAWLGQCVTPEPAPNILNNDPCDDGVVYIGLPWTPCAPAQVRVFVTGGPQYGRYANCGGRLYLNGWKDGNLDGDFCDELPCAGAVASEWIVRDVLVTPGAWGFTFIDPGVDYLGVYDGVFRWRLTSTPVGRFGFGLLDNAACPNMTCGTFGWDFLGEVEDYIIEDAQLAVELNSFTATASDGRVVLNWSTASETNNDHFVILRNDVELTTVASRGNDAAGHEYSYTDADVVNGTSYTYSLIAVDVNGTREELRTASATPRAGLAVITQYALHQNYPNPFNPTTNISFDLMEGGFVSLKVYNLMGQQVASVLSTNLSAGTHNITFDASNLSSGVYLYRLEVNGFAAEKKMLLMK